jgi:DNA-binding transcriptional MerR regulator
MNWEVRRNAEGHRVFGEADLAKLRELKSWLDGGRHLKEFRQVAYGSGEYDPRIELKANFRRVKELLSQHEAILTKQAKLLEAYAEAGHTWLRRVEAVSDEQRATTDASSPSVGDEALQSAFIVEGVLKQLLCETLARQGKLRYTGSETAGQKVRKRYVAPDGRQQVVEDWCREPRTKALLDAVVQALVSPAPVEAPVSQ